MSSANTRQSVGTDTSSQRSSTFSKETSGATLFDVAVVLSGRFDSLRFVSSGPETAFFIGHEACARAQDRPVAVRVSTGQTGRRHELFDLEALSAAKLSHRNIVKANPPEEIDGVHFAVSEHRPGAESLKDLLDREGWLDSRSAIGIAQQIADALDYAHGLGVLHLGIRPDTILIDQDGRALLTDFGVDEVSALAGAHGKRSTEGQLEMKYASPEQADGSLLDSRSDLYSLGVVLYQMLTDRPPVVSESPDSVRQKIVTHSPLSPHLYCSEIPLPLSAAVIRLLEKDPGKRFHDAASFRVELDRCVSRPFDLDDQQSKESPEQLEEEYQGDDEGLIEFDPATVSPVAAGQSWQTPIITVVNHPDDAILALESLTDSLPQTEEPAQPPDAERERKHSLNAMSPEYAFQTAPELQRNPVILQVIVGVILALAAIGGLMVIALADRAKAQNQEPVELPARGRGGEAVGDRKAAPSVDSPGEASRVTSQPTSGQPSLESIGAAASRPKATAKSTSSSVRARAVRVLRPSRLRMVKRNSWRSERYWRNYPYKRPR